MGPAAQCTLVWAYASLRCHPWHLMSTIADEVDISDLPPSSVSNLIWAYATVGHHPVPVRLLTQTAVVAEVKVADFSPIDICNLVWGFAVLGHHPGHLMDTVALTAENNLQYMGADHIANLVWAYARLDHFAGTLLEKASVAIRSRLHEFEGTSLATVTWAYSRWAGQARFAQDTVNAVSVRVAADMQAQATIQAAAMAQMQTYNYAHAQAQAQLVAQMTSMGLNNPLVSVSAGGTAEKFSGPDPMIGEMARAGGGSEGVQFGTAQISETMGKDERFLPVVETHSSPSTCRAPAAELSSRAGVIAGSALTLPGE